MNRADEKLKQGKYFSFTKIVLGVVMLMWLYGIALGSVIMVRIVSEFPDSAVQAYLGMLTYIGAPVSVAIGFYAWKSKHENLTKLGLPPEAAEADAVFGEYL